MASEITDAFVKFGEIKGESADIAHVSWCELRSCGFDLSAAESKAPGNGNGEHSTAKFESVKLSKRIDQASAQLFLKCCHQAQGMGKRDGDLEGEEKRIGKVEVEVCRPDRGQQGQLVAYVRIVYHDVRITHYSVDLAAGPEAPEEDITFEFRALEFSYVPSDPETGAMKNQMSSKMLVNPDAIAFKRKLRRAEMEKDADELWEMDDVFGSVFGND